MDDYNRYVTAINKIFDYLEKMKAGWNNSDNKNYIESIEDFKGIVTSKAEEYRKPPTVKIEPKEEEETLEEEEEEKETPRRAAPPPPPPPGPTGNAVRSVQGLVDAPDAIKMIDRQVTQFNQVSVPSNMGGLSEW